MNKNCVYTTIYIFQFSDRKYSIYIRNMLSSFANVTNFTREMFSYGCHLFRLNQKKMPLKKQTYIFIWKKEIEYKKICRHVSITTKILREKNYKIIKITAWSFRLQMEDNKKIFRDQSQDKSYNLILMQFFCLDIILF